MFTALIGKYKVYMVMAAVFGTFALVAYFYYKNTQAELKAYAVQTATLESALEQQKQTTDALKRDIRLMQDTLTYLNNEFEKSRQAVSDIQVALSENSDGSKRDIGKNAIEDPIGVEEAINIGTDEVFSCISSLSQNGGNEGDKAIIRCPSDNATGGM